MKKGKKVISLDEKQRIFHLYYSGKTYEELSEMHSRSVNSIKEIVKEMRQLAKKEEPSKERYYENLPIDRIIKDLEGGDSITKIEKKYYVSRGTVKKLLNMSEEGKHALNSALTRYQNKRKDIPLPEIVVAFQNKDNWARLQEKYNVSATTLRNRLINEYGSEYLKELRPHSDKKNKQAEKKKVLSKKQFSESLKSYSLEALLKEAEKRKIEVPEEYIKEYNKKINKTTTTLSEGTLPSNMDVPGGEER